MSKDIGVIVVGVGFVGGQAHTPSFKKISGSKLLGLCARTEKRVKPLAEKYGVRYYLDYDEALENPELDYDPDTVAQAFADKMARTGVLEHNPELPSNTGENVASRTDRGQDPKITIGLMIQDMVTDDDSNGGANRANILTSGYTELSVGVSVQGDAVYLVLNFR